MLLKNIDTVFRQDQARTVSHNIDIRIHNGKFDNIGSGLSHNGKTIDCQDKIALPGLINCHNHTPNIITRGWSDDVSLFPWLETNATVLEHADRNEKRQAAKLAAVLMVQTGTTTVNDMWNTYTVDAFTDVGIRALMGSALATVEETEEQDITAGLKKNELFIDTYKNHPTIHPTIPIHSVYRSTATLLKQAHEIAVNQDLPFHIHISETKQENEEILDRHGMTPTAWLHEQDVLDHRGVLVHAVHLTKEDRTLIANNDAGIAHCPASNLKLGSGIADIDKMKNIPIGLGTDSAASNNSLNMFREGRIAALIHKRDDPGKMSAQTILDMMTCEAANMLNMADTIGSIEEGKRADIILIDKQDPTLTPYIGDQGLLSNLIYSFHGHVDMSIINGDIVVSNSSVTADITPVLDTLEQFCSRVNDRFERPS